MKKENVLKELEENIDQYYKKGIEQNIKDLLSISSDEDVSASVAQLLLKNYTRMRSGFYAQVLQDILGIKIDLGLVRFPDNYFFSASILRGSYDMYECYMQEVIERLLEGEPSNKWEQFLIELQNVAQQYNEKIFDNYKPLIKGANYNGAFDDHETIPGAVIIHGEDYLALEGAAEKYNAIIGCRDILKDLAKRFEEVGIEEDE